jgi:hypothetical protein
MTTGLARGYLRLLVPLALAAGIALAVAFLGLGSAEAGPTAKRHRIIAMAVSNGFRVTVTAIREPEPSNEPDAATVRIAAFERSDGTWDRLGQKLTVGTRAGWFWNVVARPYGVRQVDARPAGRQVPRAHRPQAPDLARDRPLCHLPVRDRPRPAGASRRVA